MELELSRRIVKPLRQIPGKKGLLKTDGWKLFKEDPNPRYTIVWIWSMTLMRATTAAYAEVDHFEKGKVAGSGSSKNGISPAVALINDERFTATCSNHAFAYYSPIRMGDAEALDEVAAASKAFSEAVKAGDIEIEPERANAFRGKRCSGEREDPRTRTRAACGSPYAQVVRYGELGSTDGARRRYPFRRREHMTMLHMTLFGERKTIPSCLSITNPGGGHSQTPHVAVAKDEQNREAFLWHHFFGGEPLLKPPTSSHKVDKDKLTVSVSVLKKALSR